MPQINKRKICNKHTFYDAVAHPNGCPKCKQESNKDYDTNIRAKDRKKIYNSNEETEYTDEEVSLIQEHANAFCKPFFIDALNRAINNQPEEATDKQE